MEINRICGCTTHPIGRAKCGCKFAQAGISQVDRPPGLKHLPRSACGAAPCNLTQPQRSRSRRRTFPS